VQNLDGLLHTGVPLHLLVEVLDAVAKGVHHPVHHGKELWVAEHLPVVEELEVDALHVVVSDSSNHVQLVNDTYRDIAGTSAGGCVEGILEHEGDEWWRHVFHGYNHIIMKWY
jgi:hypothetical protein